MKQNKCISLLIAIALSGAVAMAQSLSEGFYRVQNLGSGRFLYVRDCTGSISTLGAELGAIELWPGVEKTYSDPSSVVFLRAIPGSSAWDLESQGSGVHDMTGYYVDITVSASGCMLYSSGQYLYELGVSDLNPEMGIIGPGTSQNQQGRGAYRIWPVHRIDNVGDNFFGIQPHLQSGNKYYTTFYADFAYSPINDVRSYYVSHVDEEHGIAVISEIMGTVGKSQPIIAECTTNLPATNKLNLTTAVGNIANGNLLNGVFFCNGSRSGISHPATQAYVEFDPTSMRMLSTDAQGQLIFTDAPANLVTQRVKKGSQRVEAQCVPANHAYLPVSSGCPSQLRILKETEYQHYIDSITPIITADTTIGLVGTLTDGQIQRFPYSAILPIDTTLTLRIAEIVRVVTTVGGQVVSDISDTTYLGSTQPNTSITRDNSTNGYACTGSHPFTLQTDATGRYTFTFQSNQLLQVAFPALPIPGITQDTLFYMQGDFIEGGQMLMTREVAASALPITLGSDHIGSTKTGATIAFTLPIDSLIRFRFMRVIETRTIIETRPPVFDYDTLWLGASAPDYSIIRAEEPTQYSICPAENYFVFQTDADGQYIFSVLNDSLLAIDFPALPVPIITCDTAFYLSTSATQWESNLLRMPYSISLERGDAIEFYIAGIINTTTQIGSRRPVVEVDTQLIGANSEEEANVVRQEGSKTVLALGGDIAFMLTADAPGAYIFQIADGGATLSIEFPELNNTGVENINTNSSEQSGIYYDLLGRACGTDFEALHPGIYILGKTKINKR